MQSVGSVIVIRRSGKDGATLDWNANKAGLLLGRHEDCDIRVQLPTVSRRHATLSVDKQSGVVTLCDHSPVNPTQLNGKPMTKGMIVVKHGDVVTVGDRKFRFEYAGKCTPAAAETFIVGGDENSAPMSANLKGDATQELSKFVRVSVPKASKSTKKNKKTLEPVKEVAEEAPAKRSAKKRSRETLPTPLKKGIAETASKMAPHVLNNDYKKFSTPMKKNIASFNIADLKKSRSIGSVVAVADSFKATVPSALPTPLKKEINFRRKSISGNAAKKSLPTPIKKGIKAKGETTRVPFKTPVKRAIEMIRQKANVKSSMKKAINNGAAYNASQIPLPATPKVVKTPGGQQSAVKAVKMAFPTLQTPIRRSINARRQSFASAKKSVKKGKMNKGLLKAIRSYGKNLKKNNGASDERPTNKNIEFLSDRLQVESFASEAVNVIEGLEKTTAISCALDSYMKSVVTTSITTALSNVSSASTAVDMGVPEPEPQEEEFASPQIVIAKDDKDDKVHTPLKSAKKSTKKAAPAMMSPGINTDANSLRTLPTPIRSSIVSMRKEYEAIEEMDVEGQDEEMNLEQLFGSRPDDADLVEDYADAFVNEGGVEDKKQAYNYALDAYLEGLGEFWASVEVVDEEEYDAEAEEAALQAEADEEEEEFNELRLAAGIPLPKSAAKPLKPRFSLPGNMGTSLLNLFWQKKEKVKNPPQPVRQSSIDDSMGDSLFSLFDDGSETVEDNFIDEVKEIVADIKVSETTINNSLALGMAVDAVLEQAAEGEGEEEEEEEESVVEPSPKKAKVEAKPAEDWSKLTVAKLKEELTKRGLDTKGKKAELVARLEAAGNDDAMDVDVVQEEEEEEEEEAASEEITNVDFSKLKVAELKDELAKRGMDTKGKKADLLKRLQGAADKKTSDENMEVVDDDDDDVKEEKQVVDWSKLTVAKLKAELTKRGLDTKGKKADLVKRLNDAGN